MNFIRVHFLISHTYLHYQSIPARYLLEHDICPTRKFHNNLFFILSIPGEWRTLLVKAYRNQNRMSFLTRPQTLSVLIFIGYILLCLVVAYVNRRRGNNFGTGFLISLILTPVIGFIIIMLTRDRHRNYERHTTHHGRRRKRKRKFF